MHSISGNQLFIYVSCTTTFAVYLVAVGACSMHDIIEQCTQNAVRCGSTQWGAWMDVRSMNCFTSSILIWRSRF